MWVASRGFSAPLSHKTQRHARLPTLPYNHSHHCVPSPLPPKPS